MGRLHLSPARLTRLRSLTDIVFFGLFGKAIGFLIPIVVAASFGVTRGTDGFFLAFAVAAALVGIWTQALEQFCVPLMAEVEGRRTVAVRMRWLYQRVYFAAAASWLIAGLGLAAYVMFVVAPPLRGSALLAYLLLAPQVLMAGPGAVNSAFLISRRKFRWSAGSIGIRAVTVVLMVWTAPSAVGLAALSLGYSLGEILRTLVLWLAARRIRAGETTERGVPRPEAGTIRRGLHQLGTMALSGVAPITERSIAATLVIGAVSRLEYASKLFYVPSALFDTNLVSVFLSDWSRLAVENRIPEMRHDLRRMLVAVAIFSTAMALAVVYWRGPLVTLALHHGSFPAREAPIIASLFAVLMIAFPFTACAMLVAGAYVALGENTFLLHVSILKMGVRTTLALVLSRWMGIYGIALAFPCTHIVELIVLVAWLRPTFRRWAIERPAVAGRLTMPTTVEAVPAA